MSTDGTNPYGGRGGGGISLPEYYRPWPAITNRNMSSRAPRPCPSTRCA
jgi:ribonuclease Z